MLLQCSNKLAGVYAKEALAAYADWLIAPAAHGVSGAARGEVTSRTETLVCSRHTCKTAEAAAGAETFKRSEHGRGAGKLMQQHMEMQQH
jgi:hypothetical protein